MLVMLDALTIYCICQKNTDYLTMTIQHSFDYFNVEKKFFFPLKAILNSRPSVK